MLLPGIKINTSATDFAPISQVQLMRFKGESGRWESVRRDHERRRLTTPGLLKSSSPRGTAGAFCWRTRMVNAGRAKELR